MRVTSGLPWPIHWVLAAVVLGVSAAVALWAFEFGKGVTGIRNVEQENRVLREELAQLRSEKDKAQSVANTSGALITAEKATQEKLTQKVQELEMENQTLQDDLRFFQELIPSNSTDNAVSIRSLNAQLLSPVQLRWQLLLFQPGKDMQELVGTLEFAISGEQGGKPWSMGLPEGNLPVKLKQYKRLSGLVSIPAQTVVKAVSVKLISGGTVRGVQTINL